MAECQCGNKEAYRLRVGHYKDEDGAVRKYEYCNVCGELGALYVPDVYFDGKPEKNLADVNGKPVEFLSKGQKAKYLKERGMVEAGDRVKGGTAFDGVFRKHAPDRETIRHESALAVKQVREMGKDFKRQEIQKIIRQFQGR